MTTKTNYIGYKLITNIKKGDLLGYFLPSKISQLAYSIETLGHGVSCLMGPKKHGFCSKINCSQMKLLYFVN